MSRIAFARSRAALLLKDTATLRTPGARTETDYGGYVEGSPDDVSVRCAVVPVTGNDALDKQAMSYEASHRVLLPATVTATTSQRFVWQGTEYQIVFAPPTPAYWPTALVWIKVVG